MKRILTVIAVLAIGFQTSLGQSLMQKAEAFRVEVLPTYNTYFSASGSDAGRSAEAGCACKLHTDVRRRQKGSNE